MTSSNVGVALVFVGMLLLVIASAITIGPMLLGYNRIARNAETPTPAMLANGIAAGAKYTRVGSYFAAAGGLALLLGIGGYVAVRWSDRAADRRQRED